MRVTGVCQRRCVPVPAFTRGEAVAACPSASASESLERMPAEQLHVVDPALSVVIPAFNEAVRLPVSLAQLRRYLDGACLSYEVVVVDDGSHDGTADLVAMLGRTWPALRVVRREHRGKGAAVRTGILAARGQLVALADADFSMPPAEFARFHLSSLDADEIAIASREALGARRYGEPGYRHLMGRVFNRLVQLLLLPGIGDTQCGFKCLHRELAVRLCERQTIPGWGFDVELLTMARLWCVRVREVPIDWYYARGSRVHPLRDTITMSRDLWSIWRNRQRGLYAAALPVRGDAVVAR